MFYSGTVVGLLLRLLAGCFVLLRGSSGSCRRLGVWPLALRLSCCRSGWGCAKSGLSCCCCCCCCTEPLCKCRGGSVVSACRLWCMPFWNICAGSRVRSWGGQFGWSHVVGGGWWSNALSFLPVWGELRWLKGRDLFGGERDRVSRWDFWGATSGWFLLLGVEFDWTQNTFSYCCELGHNFVNPTFRRGNWGSWTWIRAGRGWRWGAETCSSSSCTQSPIVSLLLLLRDAWRWARSASSIAGVSGLALCSTCGGLGVCGLWSTCGALCTGSGDSGSVDHLAICSGFWWYSLSHDSLWVFWRSWLNKSVLANWDECTAWCGKRKGTLNGICCTAGL